MRQKLLLAVAVLGVAIAFWMVACSGSSNSMSSSQMATVTVNLNDPPTCMAPNAYNHVYVSIMDVKIHQSATAAPTDSGWVDLTPSLNTAPQQVDLLSLGGNACLLAQLGSATEIQAGTYQQIRLILAPDSVTVAGNQCGSTNNCVVYNGNTFPLNLSSETQTGIKIPSGQLAGGKFTVPAGSVQGLTITFDACASIIRQGNGQFRLKPVLHAGEASTNSAAVTGQLVDGGSMNPIAGATEIVAIEQPDSSGVDRMILQVTPDSAGNFIICPAPSGPFDVVAVAQVTSGGTTIAYSATVTSGVQAGNALGKIPLFALPAPGPGAGTIGGVVTTAGTAGAISEDVSVSALEPMTIGGGTVQVTIPLVQDASTSITVTTATATSCTTGTDCASYSLSLPATLPYLGAFMASGTTWAQITAPGVDYTVDSIAFQPGSSATQTCVPSDVPISVQTDGATLLTLTPGASITAKTTAFTGCM